MNYFATLSQASFALSIALVWIAHFPNVVQDAGGQQCRQRDPDCSNERPDSAREVALVKLSRGSAV